MLPASRPPRSGPPRSAWTCTRLMPRGRRRFTSPPADWSSRVAASDTSFPLQTVKDGVRVQLHDVVEELVHTDVNMISKRKGHLFGSLGNPTEVAYRPAYLKRAARACPEPSSRAVRYSGFVTAFFALLILKHPQEKRRRP